MLINLKKKLTKITNVIGLINRKAIYTYLVIVIQTTENRLSPRFFQFYRGQEVGEGKKEENWPRWLRDMMKSMEWRGEGRGRGEHFGGLERGCRISGES